MHNTLNEEEVVEACFSACCQECSQERRQVPAGFASQEPSIDVKGEKFSHFLTKEINRYEQLKQDLWGKVNNVLGGEGSHACSHCGDKGDCWSSLNESAVRGFARDHTGAKTTQSTTIKDQATSHKKNSSGESLLSRQSRK